MRSRTSRPLWVRLSLTYVGVALLAVVILAGITAVATERYVNVLVSERRDNLTRALLVDAASTYSTGKPGWSDADLGPALDLAARSGTDVAVLDGNGAVVATTFPHPRRAAGTQRHPIVINGQRVGTLDIHFNGRGLVASTDKLRRSLLHADVWSAGVAALLALGAAVLVARRLSEPVRALTAAASDVSRGNRNARVGVLRRVPAELVDLASTFDSMADTIVAEEQLRRDLVADVAHELRTPVAVLQANAEALLDGVLPHTPEQTASLHEEILRLARMVDDLQTLASAEAAALHLTRQRCDLAGIAESAVTAMEPSAASAGVRLTHQLDPVMIEGDPVRIHQIVTNLLSNAVKFGGPGSSTSVRVGPEGRDAVLVVSDDGPGIDPEDLPHVFERFWRGHAATSPTGTGIGLSIAHDLVVAHGGRLDVASGPGGGTQVTARFPASR
ncbi:MAG TPA: HAMP domain-containing sensor histidine kinase [Mycobacteriales bacterium]|nr:HAMP domain-containing sensor histidine kinase [Mycobacteriales bacterium]